MTGSIETGWFHVTSEIGDNGLEARRVATPDELARLATDLEVLAVERLVARYRVMPLGRGRYGLSGEIAARVVQACVVTLDPVTADMTEPLEAEFRPPGQLPEPDGSEQEALAQPEVEPIEQHRLAIGRVVFETIAAALDPYPRAPGAKLEIETPAGPAEASPSPFAALAKWKPNQG